MAAPVFLDVATKLSCLKCESARLDISTINTALNIYGFDNGTYSSEEQGLEAILEYDILKRLPKDPWGQSYQYASYLVENYFCFAVWSFGGDGKPGGKEEHERDIYYESTAGNCITKQGTGRS